MLQKVHACLRSGGDVNAADSDGVTLLHQAALKADIDAVILLLTTGADCSLRDLFRCEVHDDGGLRAVRLPRPGRGMTPLFNVALAREPDEERLIRIAARMIDAGASTLVEDDGGVTPSEAADLNHKPRLSEFLRSALHRVRTAWSYNPAAANVGESVSLQAAQDSFISGDLGQALSGCRRALQEQPDDTHVRLTANWIEGRQCLREGRFDDALDRFLSIVVEAPVCAPAYEKLAETLAGRKAPGKILPTSPPDRYFNVAAHMFATDRQYHGAGRVVNRMVALGIPPEKLFVMKMQILYQDHVARAPGEKEPLWALVHFHRVFLFHPGSMEWRDRLLLQCKLVDCLRRARAPVEDLVVESSRLARAYRDVGMTEQVVRVCKEILALQPDHEDARFLLEET